MRKSFQELTFTDDFMFSKVLYSRPELCREILELLLPIHILKLDVPVEQRTVTGTSEQKGVRFDVYVRDEAETVYDIEMQVTEERDLPERSRYYHAALDMDALQTGCPYGALKKTYVIFICKNRNDAEAVSLYEMRSSARPELRLRDGNFTCFVNAAYSGEDISPELRRFLGYVHAGRLDSAEDTLAKRLEKAVSEVKKQKIWEVEYVRYEEYLKKSYEEGLAKGISEGIEKGIEKGMEKGRSEGAIQTLSALVRQALITPAQAAAISGLSEDTFLFVENIE